MNLIINNLNYNIKDNNIFTNVSLQIEMASSCVALIGENGSGKSTFLNIIAGIVKNYKGTVLVDKNINISYLPFENPIYQSFTVKENIIFWYQIYTKKKFNQYDENIKTIIELFSLKDLLEYQVKFLSSGQKRKVALACTLLSDSDLLLLDEPFTGLDHYMVNELCDIINTFKSKNKNFIISSHRFDLLNKISDQTLLIEDSKITKLAGINNE